MQGSPLPVPPWVVGSLLLLFLGASYAGTMQSKASVSNIKPLPSPTEAASPSVVLRNVSATPDPTATPEPSPRVKAVTSTNAQPSVFHLSIPSIKVEASVKEVGLTKTGNMDVPSRISEVGWYKVGAMPGNVGTAVLAGHLDGSRGEPGVFSTLSSIQVGDKVSVRNPDGKTVQFVVREKRTYPWDARADEVFTSYGGTHLNLITCTGSWDKDISKFSERLVVFTDLVQ